MKIIVHLHANKDRLYEIGEEAGLREDALHRFTFALYEVECELEVNPQTGDAILIRCEDLRAQTR